MKKNMILICFIFCFNNTVFANQTTIQQIESNNDIFKEYTDKINNSFNNDKGLFEKGMDKLTKDTENKKKEMNDNFNKLKNSMTIPSTNQIELSSPNTNSSLKNSSELNINTNNDIKNLETPTDSSIKNRSSNNIGKIDLDESDKTRLSDYYNKKTSNNVSDKSLSSDSTTDSNYQSISSTKQNINNGLTVSSFIKTIIWILSILTIMIILFNRAKKKDF